MKRVEVISKDDCSLCDDALAVIEEVRRDIGFELVVTTIREGTDVYERYHDKIPVVLIDGAEAFVYRVPRMKLIDALAR